MTKVKVIALDMDGTLLDDDGLVSDYTKQVLKQVLKKDIHVILATGRPLALCHDYAVELGLPTYLITANGGEIWTVDKKLLDQKLCQVNTIESLWELGNSLNLHMWTVATDEIFLNSTRPERFTDYKWLKIGFGRLNATDKKKLVAELKGSFTNIEVTNSTKTNIEVNAQGVNKAAALKFICEKIGISMQEVITIGDSLNDLSMIKAAGIGIAMGNAQEIIKDNADAVTDTNNNDGVAKAIEKYVLS